MVGFIPSYQALYQGLFHVDWIVEVRGSIMTYENGEKRKLPLSDISVSGGVVNLYNALQLAEKIKLSKKLKSKLPNKKGIVMTKKIDIDWQHMASDLAMNGQEYHQHFYQDTRYSGPGLHFHHRALVGLPARKKLR